MALTLYLLRHAKAEKGRLDQEDFDRALAGHGIEDATRLGEELRHNHVTFDHVWCSSAVRTKQTLEQVMQAVPPGEVDYTRKLYHASAEKMLATLQLTPPAAEHVLMVGHNPGISQLAAALARNGDRELARAVMMRYPTCTCAIFRFDAASWQEAGPDNSEIIGLWMAK